MIEFETKKATDEEIFRQLHPLLADWFRSTFGSFTEPQKYAILNIHNHQNILVTAPTGTGKTLSAFTSILNELIALAENNQLEDKVYCIYCSPLRALSNDLEKNLKEPLDAIKKKALQKGKELNIRVAVRTGDTTTSERAKMLRKPPHILILTPETMAIILNSPKFIEHLKEVQWVIIDEIHSIAGSKRGVHLSLSLERMQILNPGFCRVGLSATIAPLEEVAKFLVGMKNEKEPRDCKIVDVQFLKKLDLKVLSPLPDLINTSQEEAHSKLYALLHELIQAHKTTLIFTNTRSATERVVHNLKDLYAEQYSQANLETHHSSVSREQRLNVEERLKQGKLKCVVSSTSLELGIDIGFIDLVVLLGSPKSVARALQRCFPYDAQVLTSTGQYFSIGKIVEKRLPVEVISFDSKLGFVKNKIKEYHKNVAVELFSIQLRCGEKLTCTPNHPLLTDNGWKIASKLKNEDKVAEINTEINFDSKNPFIFELLPQKQVYVKNDGVFFRKVLDKFLDEKNISLHYFSKINSLNYKTLINYRRKIGRGKNIRLDYFLAICRITGASQSLFLPLLRNLKTQCGDLTNLPLRLTKEL
ncbi:MAG: DEAD/DEAH box helicase, partial [Candidatus ainarchaeum sp.]|nr:DEAD/DEAH box helicase [Candidatus ainarchaeum sp.]